MIRLARDFSKRENRLRRADAIAVERNVGKLIIRLALGNLRIQVTGVEPTVQLFSA